MKRILIVTALIVCSNTLYSQGFNWSEEIEQEFKNNVPELKVTRSVFPSEYSLEKYLPSRQYQGNTAMCMAYSLAVGRTILFAKNNNLTDIEEIDKHIFSPFFSYILAMDESDINCDLGLYPVEVLKIAKEYGMAKMQTVEFPNYYPYTSKRLLCSGYPENTGDLEKDFLGAYHFTIDDFSRLETTKQIKSSIASKCPVIFGFGNVPLSFMWSKEGDKYWYPEKHSDKFYCLFEYKNNTEKICQDLPSHETGFCKKHKSSAPESTMGHAMILVGYDDNINGGSFLILNSWGNEEEEWADNGKLWVRYPDFWKYTDAAMSIKKLKESSKLAMKLDKSGNQAMPSNMRKESYEKPPVAAKNIPNSFQVKKRKD